MIGGLLAATPPAAAGRRRTLATASAAHALHDGCTDLIYVLLPCLVVLPLLGAMLNGTTSVLHGTVPELAPAHRTERAFALFYTGTIGSGAVSPVLYGLLGDLAGVTVATLATAIAALATVPLAFALAPRVAAGSRPGSGA